MRKNEKVNPLSSASYNGCFCLRCYSAAKTSSSKAGNDSCSAPAPAPAKLEKFSGVVDKVDEMAKAIDVKGKVKKQEKTLTFATDDKTKITRAGKDMPFGDLKKDMQCCPSSTKRMGKR